MPDVTFVTSGHDVADARLHRLSAALQRGGLTVEVLGLGAARQGPVGAEVLTWPRGGLARRAALAAGLPWRARGRVLIALDPDVLIAAWPASVLRRRRLVADVHEDYAALVADRPWAHGPKGLLARGLSHAATTAARHCPVALVADVQVPPRSARRRLVVRNLPDPHLLPERSAPRDREPRAVYVGDLRASRGLAAMLDAVSAAPRWRLDLIGPVASADRPWFLDRLADPDLDGRVTWHGRLPPRESWRICAGAWVGFCLLDATPAFVNATASKLYEYLATGLVPVVTDLPRQRELVEQAGTGMVVANAAGAASALRLFEQRREELERQADRGRWWLKELPDGQGIGYDRFAKVVRSLLRG
jgi:glycosyltransferase involved in cell wall biosynthesis